MEINLLALNLGNTRLAIGVFVAGALEYVRRVPHSQKSDWPGVIREAWQKIADREAATVVGSSVNPPLVESIEHVVHQVTQQHVQWIGSDIDLPCKVLTDDPQKTGVDRVLNIAAAYEQMQKACVVVDAGTAITIDCCDDSGAFLGGAIAAGTRLLLESLHERAAQLPTVEFDVPKEPFGKSTEQAMLNAAYHGVRGMVKELVENYATELGNWPEIIATGGDAPKLFENWELIHAISPDLTLYGVALAYANHHIKHGT